ncbi:metal-dependent phosphohydrolase [Streptomyces avidinii]|uniref:HD superfamily phosphodiesterase n=1 Tax=Streptomyces avidinii TaxID=1895 RepID=A0ABS4KZH1_STRAV|nr:metal-dependent phosphohydrolase [Streptomyces avidinii]MBP2035428.1 HD superfamily phosphodiesterase [Streptomyces avidinii]
MPYVASVLELMELLHGGPDDQGLRTAALLRRSHPFDKELQLAGLLHDIGRLLRLSDGTVTVGVAAEAIRPLLGRRVARLVRLSGAPGEEGAHGEEGAPGARHDAEPDADTDADAAAEADSEAVATLRHARDSAAAADLDAGVLEDWRPLLDLVAAGARRGGPARNALDPLGAPRGSRRPVRGRP